MMSLTKTEKGFMMKCDGKGGCGFKVEYRTDEKAAWAGAARVGWIKDPNQKNLDGATGDPDRHLCYSCRKRK